MNLCHSATIAAALVLLGGPATGQDGKDRRIEQYECKDVMRDSGANRDVAIAFLHGYLLGKSGGSAFNLSLMQQQTDAFVERCLDNPREKAVEAMSAIRK